MIYLEKDKGAPLETIVKEIKDNEGNDKWGVFILKKVTPYALVKSFYTRENAKEYEALLSVKRPKFVKIYQKNPRQIEAMEFIGTLHSVKQAQEWLGSKVLDMSEIGDSGMFKMNIGTLEGPHICSPGDYIIKGIHGEFYPCKDKIFHKLHTLI